MIILRVSLFLPSFFKQKGSKSSLISVTQNKTSGKELILHMIEPKAGCRKSNCFFLGLLSNKLHKKWIQSNMCPPVAFYSHMYPSDPVCAAPSGSQPELRVMSVLVLLRPNFSSVAWQEELAPPQQPGAAGEAATAGSAEGSGEVRRRTPQPGFPAAPQLEAAPGCPPWWCFSPGGFCPL